MHEQSGGVTLDSALESTANELFEVNDAISELDQAQAEIDELRGKTTASVEAAAQQTLDEVGGLDSHKNRYSDRDPSECPFLSSMGKAGIELMEKFEAAKNDPNRGKTMAELMAEKKQQKQSASDKVEDLKPIEQVKAQATTSATPTERQMTSTYSSKINVNEIHRAITLDEPKSFPIESKSVAARSITSKNRPNQSATATLPVIETKTMTEEPTIVPAFLKPDAEIKKRIEQPVKPIYKVGRIIMEPVKKLASKQPIVKSKVVQPNNTMSISIVPSKIQRIDLSPTTQSERDFTDPEAPNVITQEDKQMPETIDIVHRDMSGEDTEFAIKDNELGYSAEEFTQEALPINQSDQFEVPLDPKETNIANTLYVEIAVELEPVIEKIEPQQQAEVTNLIENIRELYQEIAVVGVIDAGTKLEAINLNEIKVISKKVSNIYEQLNKLIDDNLEPEVVKLILSYLEQQPMINELRKIQGLNLETLNRLGTMEYKISALSDTIHGSVTTGISQRVARLKFVSNYILSSIIDNFASFGASA